MALQYFSLQKLQLLLVLKSADMDTILNPEHLIKTIGLLGVFLAIFAESGLLVGIILPGDSLLFTAGIFAAAGYISLPVLIVGVAIAAVVGDSVGFKIGHALGPKLFTRDESWFFKRRYAEDAQKFFAAHGARSLILARFIPIIRTLVPMIAGVGNMPYKTFLKWNIVGGILWSLTVPILGYYLGRHVPDIDTYLLPIVLVISFISLLPTFIGVMRAVFKK